MTGIQTKYFTTGRIRKADHDPALCQLELVWGNKTVLDYKQVPEEVFRRLCSAPSPTTCWEDRIAEEYPKGAVHMTDLGWSFDTVYLAVLPMFHLGGLSGAYCLLSLAARQHYVEKFDATVFLERLASERISATGLSPVSIGWLLDSPRPRQHDLSALRQLGYGYGYGTAPITEAILRNVMERLPGVKFTQIYLGDQEFLIAGYKCPKSVDIRATPLPLSIVNKVQKQVLREAYWRGQTRRVN